MGPQLILTIDEVKLQVPVNMTSDFDVIAPFLRTAEVSYLIRYIGADQFNALQTLYGAHTADPDYLEAISLAQKVIANLGYYFAVPILSVSIGSSGIQIMSNQDTKQAFQWQVEDIKISFQEIGFLGLEELLVFLQAAPDKFPEYAASAQQKEQQACLITTASEFSSFFDINQSRFVFQSIAYIMNRIEQQDMVRLVGATFLASLKQPGISPEKVTLVETYFKPGIALLTVAKALTERVLVLKDGLVAFNFLGRTGNQNQSQPATAQQIGDSCAQLVNDGNMFIQDGLEYIAANPTDFLDFTPQVPRRRFRVENRRHKGLFAN